jgi:hypothetical protein
VTVLERAHGKLLGLFREVCSQALKNPPTERIDLQTAAGVRNQVRTRVRSNDPMLVTMFEPRGGRLISSRRNQLGVNAFPRLAARASAPDILPHRNNGSRLPPG